MVITVQVLLKNIRNLVLLVLGTFCLLATGCSQQLSQYSAPIEAQYYPVLKYSLIELIDTLPKPPPITLEQAQALFNNQLHLKIKNDYYSFYEGGPFITQDGIVVTNARIAAKNNSKIPVESIGFSFDQRQCVNTKLLKHKYNFHILYFNTRNPEKHPPISYGAGLDWGGFGVGTSLDNEDCATSIGVGLK